MKLVAGRNGMDNIVRWVHIVEDIGVPDLLHGNELVFTTGIGHSGSDWLEEFAEGLREHNAAGLVVNLGPYIDAIPSKAIVYCEEHDFPLFTLPWKSHIIDITYSFCRRIIDREEAETSLAEAFRNLIFFPDSRDDYAPVLERQGFHESTFYTVIAVLLCGSGAAAQNIKDSRSGLRRILRHTRNPAALFVQDEKIICIRQNATNDELRRLTSDLNAFECGLEIKVGLSEQCEGYAGIPSGYKQAVSALEVSRIKGVRVMNYRSIGIYKLLFGVENRAVLREYVNDVLGSLINCDDTNGTDYEETLRIYLENSGSIQKTAAVLGVHRNTANYKIKAIRRILNVEMSDEDKMNILLALHAKQILQNRGNAD